MAPGITLSGCLRVLQAEPPYGADVLRLWVASVDATGGDVGIGPGILNQVRCGAWELHQMSESPTAQPGLLRTLDSQPGSTCFNTFRTPIRVLAQPGLQETVDPLSGAVPEHMVLFVPRKSAYQCNEPHKNLVICRSSCQTTHMQENSLHRHTAELHRWQHDRVRPCPRS